MARYAFFLLLLLAPVAGCTSGSSEPAVYTLPAEWEAHDAVWVSFFGGPMDAVSLEIVKAVAASTPVKCVVPAIDFTGSPAPRLGLLVQARLEEMGVDLGNIEIIRSDSLVQTRDTGPIFVRNAAGELRVADFRWNNYGAADALADGYQDTYPFDALMAARMEIPSVRSRLALEGGAIETNGLGTLLQVESVTLQRNPGLSKAEIEEELKQALGQKKVIWLREGPAEDPHGMSLITEGYVGSGVGGHVDEFARFAGPRTILLAFPDSAEAAEDPVKQITRERMQVNYEILKNATDQDGQPFEILKMPVPDLSYEPFIADTAWTHPVFRALLDENPALRHGDTLRWVPAGSYLNFFVTNKVVLIPAYGQPGSPPSVQAEDEQVRATMQRFFPDRQIVGINAVSLNNNGGGLHCWTQQQPARR